MLLTNIDVRYETWIPSGNSFKPMLKEGVQIPHNTMVEALFHSETCHWKHDVIRKWFALEDVQRIIRLYGPSTGGYVGLEQIL